MNEYSKRKSTEESLNNFLKLPKECQMLFFALLDSPLDKYGINSFYDFVVGNEFDYSDCESPIEIMLAMAFDFITFTRACPINDYYIERQENINTQSRNYRADFVFHDLTSNVQIVVECDGHDFHEKTKEQVKRNNERDYDLKMSGYEVIHFSGSEVFESPLNCAYKVFKYAESRGNTNA